MDVSNENTNISPSYKISEDEYFQLKKLISENSINNDLILFLLKSNNDKIKKNKYELFSLAIIHNNPTVVTFFLQNSEFDPAQFNNSAIILSIEHKHLQIFQLLLNDNRTDPSDSSNLPIRLAANKGYIDFFQLLVINPLVDPTTPNNKTIKDAVSKGHIHILKILLNDNRIDPCIDNNWIIKTAIRKKHTNIIKLLLGDDRINFTKDIFELFLQKYCDQDNYLEHKSISMSMSKSLLISYNSQLNSKTISHQPVPKSQFKSQSQSQSQSQSSSPSINLKQIKKFMEKNFIDKINVNKGEGLYTTDSNLNTRSNITKIKINQCILLSIYDFCLIQCITSIVLHNNTIQITI